MDTKKIMNVTNKISKAANEGGIIFAALTGVCGIINLGSKAMYNYAKKQDPEFLKAKAEQEAKDRDAILEKRAKYEEEAKAWAEKKVETEIPKLEKRINELQNDIRKQKNDQECEIKVLKEKYAAVLSEKEEMGIKLDNLKSAIGSISDKDDENKKIVISLA